MNYTIMMTLLEYAATLLMVCGALWIFYFLASQKVWAHIDQRIDFRCRLIMTDLLIDAINVHAKDQVKIGTGGGHGADTRVSVQGGGGPGGYSRGGNAGPVGSGGQAIYGAASPQPMARGDDVWSPSSKAKLPATLQPMANVSQPELDLPEPKKWTQPATKPIKPSKVSKSRSRAGKKGKKRGKAKVGKGASPQPSSLVLAEKDKISKKIKGRFFAPETVTA